VNESRLAFLGAWRLAHADASGLAYFDRSIDGLWRSFRVAIYCAPMFVLQLAIVFDQQPPVAGWARVTAVELIAYGIGWLVFPVLMDPVCRWIGREQAYVGYIVAYNWSSLVISFVWVPGALLAITAFGPFGAVAAKLVLFAYLWFIARTALSIGGGAAAAIAVLDFALSYALDGVTDSMIY
jgi:hypothetical protein